MNTSLLDDLRDGIPLHLASLTVDQYQQMIRDGILSDADPMELIQGALVYKDRRDELGSLITHGPRHLRALNKLMAVLSQWVAGKSVFLEVQGPIILGESSEPEPDCCLVRGEPDDFSESLPHAADVVAVFEVAYSSLLSDRRTKQRLYASEGIPIYVIVNLHDSVIELLSQPSIDEQRYVLQTVCGPATTVSIRLDSWGRTHISRWGNLVKMVFTADLAWSQKRHRNLFLPTGPVTPVKC